MPVVLGGVWEGATGDQGCSTRCLKGAMGGGGGGGYVVAGSHSRSQMQAARVVLVGEERWG